MSEISGIYNIFNRNIVSSEVLESICTVLSHRCPDVKGRHQIKSVICNGKYPDSVRKIVNNRERMN